MLPPLSQLVDARIAAESAGPSREALHRPSAPALTASVRPGNGANPRRSVSAAKPPPPSALSSASTTAAAVFSSPRRATYRPSILSPRTPLPTSTTPCDVQPLATPSNGTAPAMAMTAIETISRVPREFFVVETNAVLPVTQYPPAQYQSTFVGSGAWETVVFPALTPHTRQQVLCLRQTLETMRIRAAASGSLAVSTAMLTVEYTEKEWALHSLCFHELARQVKWICREQSELLFEIQAAYDASVARLAMLVRQLEQQRTVQDAQLHTLREQLRVATDEESAAAARAASNQRDADSVFKCICGRSGFSRRGPPHRRGSYGDEGDEDDEDGDEDEDEEWRAFQRQRRQRLRQFMEKDKDDDGEEDDSDGGCRGRLRRASVVEENTAAARVQQAFAKYQQRKEAARQLQRQEKKVAALDIQRSYRGYRERKRALHHRAVMHTILKRRKQVAAVELLQMNVRAYLIKKRREGRHGLSGGADDDDGGPATARASMLEAQRVAALALASSGATAALSVASSEPRHAASPSSTPTPTDATDTNGEDDRFAQLLNNMSELAAAFSFLHSRRRNAKKALATTTETAVDIITENEAEEKREAHLEAEVPAEPLATASARQPGDNHHAEDEKEELVASADCTAEVDDAERALLDATIRRAEDLMVSFKSVISDLRPGDASLTKATSTTTLPPGDGADGPGRSQGGGGATSSLMDALGPAALLFLDEPGDPVAAGRASPEAADQNHDATLGDGSCNANDDDGDADDATHLDDVLWQAAVYAPASREDRADEASARRLLLRELLASRDQQKRLAALKQFIADIYDTVVGRLRELPRARLDKLVHVHASLALSFQDAKRLLRRRTHVASTSANEYEPVSAFVGRLELQTLIRDHFHCHVGLRHLVDAASDRVAADLRHFMGLDADVQRFHEYLTHERSLEDLVFFCLCRLLARDAAASNARQPVFHRGDMRELVDARCAREIAARLFHAGGDDASLAATDAFVIEPANENYARHLPSHGLAQLEAILRDFVAPVDAVDGDGEDGDGVRLQLSEHVRATNASHFHAPAYNASAPRSPLKQQQKTHGANWLFFTELVDVLRRYRSVMRHFHAFVEWTYELFHAAFRQQRLEQQQLQAPPPRLDTAAGGAPLLEEAAFVATLLPYSRGASDRELRNVFHNALKQRQLQRLMPARVFVSVVLVLLRNGLLSVTSYRPLAQAVQAAGAAAAAKQLATDASAAASPYLGAHRRQREETQWLQLALQWRAQEQRFEAAIERLYAPATETSANDEAETEADTETDGERVAAASRLLQWRNELYELFVLRSGRVNLERAQLLYEQLAEEMARCGDDDDALGRGDKAAAATAVLCGPETDEVEHDEDEHDGRDGAREQQSVDDVAAAATVGSPWAVNQS